jgi:hypothetical protein
VMTELSEIQAVLAADAHREPDYRLGQVPPIAWPTVGQLSHPWWMARPGQR